ncbi:unnamed protein product [Prunus armeniaca]
MKTIKCLRRRLGGLGGSRRRLGGLGGSRWRLGGSRRPGRMKTDEACTRSPIFKIQILGLEPLSQLKLGFFFSSVSLATSDEHPRQFLSIPEEAEQMVL